ncbi:MAG: type 4a pilus biogenesis protein PilO [Phycisphaerae bacterium]|jgi:Tfp pilus assembly protein PilO
MQVIKNKQFVMSIAVVTLAVAFVFLQYLPLSKKAKSLSTANAQLIADNTAINARVDVLPQLYVQIEEMKQQIGNFDAKIPLGRSHGTFLQKLAEVMQQHGLTELVIQPGSEIETPSLSGIPVNIRCSGKLVQIFRFFKAMESFERVVRVSEVSLANDNKLDGILIMNAKVEMFYRTQ